MLTIEARGGCFGLGAGHSLDTYDSRVPYIKWALKLESQEAAGSLGCFICMKRAQKLFLNVLSYVLRATKSNFKRFRTFL